MRSGVCPTAVASDDVAKVEAIFLQFVSGASFAAMNCSIRMASEELHPLQIIALRNVLVVCFLLVVLDASTIAQAWRALIGPSKWRFIANGFVNLGTMIAWFWSVTLLPLAAATSLFFSKVVFATCFAAILLKESILPWPLIGAIVTVAGVAIAVGSDLPGSTAGIALALISGLTGGLAVVLGKALYRLANPSATLLTFLAVASLPCLVVSMPFWKWSSDDKALWIIGTAIFSLISQVSFTRAYAIADVSLLSPLEATRIVFGALLGYWAFSELPARTLPFGTAIIVAGAVMASRRSSLKG